MALLSSFKIFQSYINRKKLNITVGNVKPITILYAYFLVIFCQGTHSLNDQYMNIINSVAVWLHQFPLMQLMRLGEFRKHKITLNGSKRGEET